MQIYELIDKILTKNRIFCKKTQKFYSNLAILKDKKGNFWIEGYLESPNVFYDRLYEAQVEDKIIKTPYSSDMVKYFKVKDLDKTFELVGEE